ncbi:hypothetical protein [Cupriavidus pampae]|uniref:Uncharacterized protein n=1 Tax=Cupriavidus pampae TaxID=659251 RepID=A0ABM8XC87_9BURK|nr:hypothetical protein [Cupriavidus pampae]CAG9177619.1 hypothetical protein LMG32289_03858 [Cupriavidus pampae]
MSAFCVFGMTITHAAKLAEKRLEKNGADVGCKTKEEWRDKVRSAAEVILTNHAPVQVSPTFDAPQFARDWIEVARTTSKIYAPIVMVRTTKVDKHGNTVISKATGQPALGWSPYKA